MPGLKLARILTALSARQARVPRRTASPRRTLAALLGLLIGYPLFAVGGYWVVQFFSTNRLNHSIEASMIAVFAVGPLGAVIGLVVGMVLAGRRRMPPTAAVAEDI